MTLLQMFKGKKLELEGLQGSVGHSQTFINQGWIEALAWVINELEVEGAEVVNRAAQRRSANVVIQAGNAKQEMLFNMLGITADDLQRADGNIYVAKAARDAGVEPNKVDDNMIADAKRLLLSMAYLCEEE